MNRTGSVVSANSEFVSFANRFSKSIGSWSPFIDLFHLIMAYSLLINVVAGRSLYSHSDALRENLTSDVNAINQFTNNQSTPKVCTFGLDTETAQITLAGRITVITKFDSDHFVMRQVIMFNKLESRFRNGGFLNTQFVVVYADNSDSLASSPTVPTSSIEGTTESSNTTSDNPNPTFADPIERVPTVYNVTVLKENRFDVDNPKRSPFEFFEPHSCYVFDPCGRLAYIIYYPWSNIQRPFVKASILSTNFDHPCGKCENSVSTSSTSTETISTKYTEPSSTTQQSTTAASWNDHSIDPVSRVHLNGPASTSATKRRANLIRIDLKPAEDKAKDDSFKIPLQIVVPTDHAHLEVQPDNNSSSNETNYIKFKFMVLRTGDPDFHGHIPTDQPERLTRLFSPNQTMLLASETDQPVANVSSSESVINDTIVLVDEYDNRFLGLSNSLPTNESIPTPVLSTYVSTLGQVQFTKDFVNLQAIREYDTNRNLTNLLSPDEAMALIENRTDDPTEDKSVYQLSEEQRHSNEHYSQILQWIQFVL